MKNNFKNIALALLLTSACANAQQWIGSNSPNADITRTGNVTIGTSAAPTATLDVRGTVRLQTINNDESAKKVMMIDKDNLVVYKDISTLFTIGCATTNYLTKRTSAGGLSCSSILDDGSKVNIGTGTSTIFDATSLNVGKNIKVSGTTQMADNAFVVTTGSLPTKYLYFKNDNKTSPSNIWKMGNTRYNSPDPYITYNGFSLIEGDTNVTRLFVQDGTGKVGIGTVSLNCTGCDDYLLFVKKGIKSERIKVEISGLGGWADHVFANDYKLRPCLK
ncbi:hypothetical protein [Flavobacterium sp. 3HN19-14]|uniref:hypothetical protein n=1 Tax=Flavobacterium sp. 3HN19-14 TaxID=3448133 RepID=UPI003EE15E32